MTVAQEAQPTIAVDRAAAEQKFTEVYQQHYPRLRLYIWKRLDVHQEQLAEEFAQDVMLVLWRKYLLRGETVEHPVALLYTIARSTLRSYRRTYAAQESVLDLGDPVNTPIIATGHAYASETPELAASARELHMAMERMAVASKRWRDQHKEIYKLRSMLEDEYIAKHGKYKEGTKERLAEQLNAADKAEAERLAEFQRTCQEVGKLRAEVEAVAGPGWQSSNGMLAGQCNPTTTPATHCANGHLLDKDNSYFRLDDGTRRCRTCRRACDQAKVPKQRKRRQSTPSNPPTPPTPPAVLEAARSMLLDPTNEASLESIAELVGTSATTMRRRLPEECAIRRARRSIAREAVPAGAAR